MSGDKSGKDNSSGLYVTYEHFRDFTTEFRHHAQRVEGALQSMGQRLSEGSQRFVRQEAEVQSLKSRTDEHSDLVKVLAAEKLGRDAIAQHTKPKRNIVESVVGNVSAAVVIGVLLIAFNIYRDWDRAKQDPPQKDRAHPVSMPPSTLAVPPNP